MKTQDYVLIAVVAAVGYVAWKKYSEANYRADKIMANRKAGLPDNFVPGFSRLPGLSTGAGLPSGAMNFARPQPGSIPPGAMTTVPSGDALSTAASGGGYFGTPTV